jgi:alanine dehydrogenase
MRIGIPREIKTLEGRVALVPAAVGELVANGHEVFIERTAGTLSGYADEDYQAVGANLKPTANDLYEAAELIVKVKEPIEPEFSLLRPDHLLFCYLHLAALPELTAVLQGKVLTAVGWETVSENGRLPLLVPMSDIAGRLAVQIASNLLQHINGGSGVLLGGLPAADRAHVVIIGPGTVGTSAATVAAALGARVTVFGRHRESLERMHALAPNITALPSFGPLIEETVPTADVLIGATLMPGGRATTVVSSALVQRMRPGSVIIDVAIDQGGCIETSRPTSWADPTYTFADVIHFGVTNMPGAVPRSASQALSTSVMPYVLRLARSDGLADPALKAGINIQDGEIVHPGVQAAVSRDETAEPVRVRYPDEDD